MTRRVLYVLAVPADSNMKEAETQKTNLTERGVVDGDRPSVETVSSQPEQFTLQGGYRGVYAELMAEEFEELFSNNSIHSVAFYGLDEDGNRKETQRDGYYQLKDVNRSPGDPRDDTKGYHKWDGRLTYKGGKKTHWRAIKTNPTDITSSNPYSSGGTDYVYAPATASKVRWFDPAGGSVSGATVQNTNATEFVDVDAYDPGEPNFSPPALVYEMPYQDEGKTDTKIWDTFGRTKDDTTRVDPATKVGSAKVSGGHLGVTNSWARVFDPSHEFEGNAIVSNARFRLRFNESANSMTAEEWSSGSWSSVSLNSSNYELFDVDIVRAGDDRVEVQATWDDSGTLDYTDIVLHRGANRALVLETTNAGAFPSDLQNKLNPIALDWDYTPIPERTLISRQKVRR
jgi:hypothetical protein